MVEIFLTQFVAAALGAASTALADWSYRRAHINQRVHSFWVSASIAVICLPVLVWTCHVFLGFEVFGRIVAGLLVGTIFCWAYRNMQKTPPLHQPGLRGAPPRPSSDAVPPEPKFNH